MESSFTMKTKERWEIVSKLTAIQKNLIKVELKRSPAEEILPDLGLDTLARFVYANKERWKRNWDG
jgi:hypothetical protein